MQALPIDSLLAELCARVREAGAAVLEAPPGAGKTTRVPIALHESGLTAGLPVLVAEPRRLAARMAARRVASERGERVGERIGYSVRFEEVGGPGTQVFYVTEGILLRRLLANPTLRGVGAVVLDEFHERHVETDLLLALLRRLREGARPDLVLLVMSATLDAEPVAAFLGDCPRLRSEGRLFPIEIEHLPEPDSRPLEKQVVSAVRRFLDLESDGDLLVFLPGAAEIRKSQVALQTLAREKDLSVVPLHGDLPLSEQVRAIERGDARKVVLSTNVAESSVTIDGVSGVIDSGLARVAMHSPWTGLPSLTTVKVSRASCVQRAGRAGRQRPGRVLRLYTKGDFATRPEQEVPELLRADLTEALLIARGAIDVDPKLTRADRKLAQGTSLEQKTELRWLAEPPSARLSAGMELLELLGALESDGELTKIGRRMLELPLHPRLARILIEGEARSVGARTALLCAVLGERDLRLSSRTRFGAADPGVDSASGPSDLLELMDAFELARELRFDSRRLESHGLDPRTVEAVGRAEKQLLRLLRSPRGSTPGQDQEEEVSLLLAVLTGFLDRLARRRKPQSLELLLASGKTARLSPKSVVRDSELLLAIDVEEHAINPSTAGATVRLASAVRAEWLLDFYSERLTLKEELLFNPSSERVEALSRLAFGAVALEETQIAAPPSAEAAAVLAKAILEYGEREFVKNDAVSALLERIAVCASRYPAANFPAFDHGRILEQLQSLCASAFVTSFGELRALDFDPATIVGLGPSERQLLDRAAPERVRLPGGRSVPVHYDPEKPPWIESRLQDFFGMADGPRLCDGAVPVTLHLLAPNGRAVQVTSDLAGFWLRHYPAIRRELMRRYPRHAWPEDGRHAEPPRPRSRQ